MARMRKGTLPAITLVLVIAWALAAVFMLTRTLAAAQDIDGRVVAVNNQVGPIDEDLDATRLAGETATISQQILVQAKPLAGLLDQTLGSTESIDKTAKSVLETAEQINATVGAINETVTSINPTVDEIGAKLNAVEGNVNSIQASVNAIGNNFVEILSEVQSIDVGAAGINRRANVVTEIAVGIEGDLSEVFRVVGVINANADAIANSPLLLQSADELPLQQLTALMTGGATPLPAPVSAPKPSQALGNATESSPLPRPDELAGMLGLTGGKPKPLPDADRALLGLLGGKGSGGSSDSAASRDSGDSGEGLVGGVVGGGGLW